MVEFSIKIIGDDVMKLNDKQIKEYSENNSLISPFSEELLGCISYDLQIKEIILIENGSKKEENYILKPGQVIFISTEEDIKLTDDLIGVVHAKNSRIRQGLDIQAPMYQPGHHTKIFIRVMNISSSEIELNTGDKIAQISFEKIEDVENPYNGTFQEEFNYRGLGKYDSEYKIKAIKKQINTLEKIESKLYGVVAGLMAIFVAIISIITSNSKAIKSINEFLFVNLLTISTISMLFGILSLFIPKNTKAINKPTGICFLISIVCFFISIFLGNYSNNLYLFF